MTKIRIAFIIDTIEYQMGGTERQLLLLLQNLDKNRYIPYICVLKTSDWIKDNFNNYNFFCFGFHSFFAIKSYVNLLKLVRFLKKESVDIVQTMFRDSNITGVIAAKLAGIKIIISARRNHGYWINRRELVVLRFLNTMTTKFLVNSAVIKESMVKRESIHPDKISVIHNGVVFTETQLAESQKLQLKTDFHIPAPSPVVVMVANLRPIKALDIFVESAKLVLEKLPETHFIVIGEGDERAKLEQLISKLNLNHNVKLLGKRDDVPDILGISDLGVLSSESEGLSNAIIEYMASGLPVVCTDVGGAREMIKDGNNGFCVPSGDVWKMAEAIITILSDPEKMTIMGTASKRRAQELFNLEKMIKAMEDYYSACF